MPCLLLEYVHMYAYTEEGIVTYIFSRNFCEEKTNYNMHLCLILITIMILLDCCVYITCCVLYPLCTWFKHILFANVHAQIYIYTKQKGVGVAKMRLCPLKKNKKIKNDIPFSECNRYVVKTQQ